MASKWDGTCESIKKQVEMDKKRERIELAANLPKEEYGMRMSYPLREEIKFSPLWTQTLVMRTNKQQALLPLRGRSMADSL